jgi:hypothetical protein
MVSWQQCEEVSKIEWKNIDIQVLQVQFAATTGLLQA